MKYHKFKAGLKQRQDTYKQSEGTKKPGSLTGTGPYKSERYRRGIGSKRSQQAILQRGAAS